MRDPRFAKLVVFVNSAVPLTMLAWDALHDNLGANPVEFAIRTTGMLTLIFLLLTLTVTPIRKLTGWNWLSHFRRMLGLYAFFYGCLHFLTYFGFYQSFNVKNVLADTIKRWFILFGMTALLMMVPLAITSTNGMIKRMGAKRWKQLHWLIYPAAIAGVLHYYLLVKADTTIPALFGVVLGLLLWQRVSGKSTLKSPRMEPSKPV
jgi:DMSO/TMAO reductase YedYZ heme-binding membrane subunit